ncbi:hypothetical protein NC651_022107 [Populus alba x Populus x berolinensis]|nr:hypothetical protein NC651_022107 [Populus alba x Populus x berolinensis]
MEVVGIRKHKEKVKKGMAEDETYRYKKKGVMVEMKTYKYEEEEEVRVMRVLRTCRYKEQEVMMAVEVGIYRLMMGVKVVIKNMVTCIHNKVAGKRLVEVETYRCKE